MLFGLVALGIVVIIVVVAASRRNDDQRDSALFPGRRSPVRLAYPVDVALAADGFWLQGAAIPLGALIAYVYVSQGISRSGRVRFAPGTNGHFVYTGSKPTTVEILRVVEDGSDDSLDVDYLPTSDSTVIDPNTSVAGAAAWFATQSPPATNLPLERSDPPAY